MHQRNFVIKQKKKHSNEVLQRLYIVTYDSVAMYDLELHKIERMFLLMDFVHLAAAFHDVRFIRTFICNGAFNTVFLFSFISLLYVARTEKRCLLAKKKGPVRC